MKFVHAISVGKKDVQAARRLLTEQQLLSSEIKIHEDAFHKGQERMKIATNRFYEQSGPSLGGDDLQNLHQALSAHSIDFQPCVAEVGVAPTNGRPWSSPLNHAINHALQSLPQSLVQDNVGENDWARRSTKLAYNVYEPMLLLGARTMESAGLTTLAEALVGNPMLQTCFFASICEYLHVSHIAVNAPISARLKTHGSSIDYENVLRSPVGLEPLYGDFGRRRPPYPEHSPDTGDFENAFWVKCLQNGVVQTWAPWYTMFSQGNVSEKARLLGLQTVHQAVLQGRQSEAGSTAVDLFAGIGYFAFSYVKAGVDKVICWDLNPWSVEGLRRGAAANDWECKVVKPGVLEERGLEPLSEAEIVDALQKSVKVVAFTESNIHAMSRVKDLQLPREPRLPPIRHVNAGMLPSAAMAWVTAVSLIDVVLGGWIHLHESTLSSELETRLSNIISEVRQVWLKLTNNSSSTGNCPSHCQEPPSVQHIEKVKSMGPKLLHVVVDIWIPPRA
ncbi:MAG: hypothetical protein Q9159_007415 [Coniocarpon cinnabarinum]